MTWMGKVNLADIAPNHPFAHTQIGTGQKLKPSSSGASPKQNPGKEAEASSKRGGTPAEAKEQENMGLAMDAYVKKLYEEDS
jgi:hypothetical protein